MTEKKEENPPQKTNKSEEKVDANDGREPVSPEESTTTENPVKISNVNKKKKTKKIKKTVQTVKKDDSRTSVRSPIPERERYKVTLLHDLEKQHTCPQCNEAMRYPVKFDECDHRVCSSCFHEFLRVEPRCPVDQVPINKEKASLDHELNEKIMSLGAKCNNAEWGCKWEGLVKESQPHSEKCEFTDILCVNDCGAKFQRRFLQKHLDKDCPKKLISCAFCDERFYREEKKTHLEDCLKVPLPCPNKCDKKLTIPRDELDNHIETACPRTKIVCQFEEIGCPHRCSREKLSRHYKAGIIEHVRLLYDVVMKQGQRLDQHHELLQDHGALLETHQAQITDMERIARNQLIWRIDEYGRKFKEAKSGNTTTLFSPPFNTSKHGYRLCASLCLNGDGKGKGTHISAFISILRGAYDNLLKWPFSYRVTFYLLDQNSDPSLRKHIKFSIKPNPCADNEPFLGQPKMEKNASFGGAKFAKHEDAESRTYIKDDTIFLKISVDCDGSVEP
ncbi:TNF receptor-associated factor 4-like isoform X2 [Hydractinia symbiolongicarpus]|uniref:TNF receptor-associated factor 4-like isoform X2 n=1 Tax=Hydractinia symbiolongicarpus TaxID=13093 RepID=UPI00254D7886|nr:TNF receptor-associated factor 4-like isoform X2 [Hydractinia symbiolongicarpus]